MNYITCKELIDFIFDYVSGELPAADRHEFERHLHVCPPCIAYLDTYKEAVRLGKDAMKEVREAPVPEELVKVILACRTKRE